MQEMAWHMQGLFHKPLKTGSHGDRGFLTTTHLFFRKTGKRNVFSMTRRQNIFDTRKTRAGVYVMMRKSQDIFNP